MPRILHIDTGREMRGGQWQALHLMRGLAGRGYVQALMTQPESPLALKAAQAGVETIPVSFRAVASISASFDLVHAHDARAHTLAAIASRRFFVVSRRVAFPIRRGPASWWKYRRATRFLAVSEYVKKQLMKAEVPDAKICVIYDGVEEPEKPEQAGRELIVALQSEDPGKLNRLIGEACAVAGVAVQFSQDLSADLARARLFVYLSESEGLGSAALLAMAHGVPVIASRVGGLPEAVTDGVTGFLVQNDVQGVAAAIRRTLDDPVLLAQFGENARRRFEERFTLDRMIDGTVAVYQEALEC
ncbi:MAG: glycosyltransferase family 4 protein [Bryobacteraceae bacterium]